MPSKYTGVPTPSTMGILMVCSHRVPVAVRIGSAGTTTSLRSFNVSRSRARRTSASSALKRSWSFLPRSASRGNPRSSSPARLKRSKRRSVALFRKIIAGTVSMIESSRLVTRRSSSSLCFRREMSRRKACQRPSGRVLPVTSTGTSASSLRLRVHSQTSTHPGGEIPPGRR